MPTIDTMTGITTGNSFYLATVRAARNGTGVEVTPLVDTGTQPSFTASAAENVAVNPTLKKLLDKAGLSPPPPGKVLSIAHVNDRLAVAVMTTDERLEVKNGLVRMNMIELGRRHSVFD